MIYVYWGDEMTYLELGHRVSTSADETNSIMHRFVRAFGVPYDISHNYWGRG